MERTGVPGGGFTTVYGYFNDRGNPSVAFVDEASRRLGVDFVWLARGTEGEGVDPDVRSRLESAATTMTAAMQAAARTFLNAVLVEERTVLTADHVRDEEAHDAESPEVAA